MMDGTPLRQVDDFVYLGGTISSNGSSSSDVSHIIGLTCVTAEHIMRGERHLTPAL